MNVCLRKSSLQQWPSHCQHPRLWCLLEDLFKGSFVGSTSQDHGWHCLRTAAHPQARRCSWSPRWNLLKPVWQQAMFIVTCDVWPSFYYYAYAAYAQQFILLDDSCLFHVFPLVSLAFPEACVSSFCSSFCIQQDPASRCVEQLQRWTQRQVNSSIPSPLPAPNSAMKQVMMAPKPKEIDDNDFVLTGWVLWVLPLDWEWYLPQLSKYIYIYIMRYQA